MKTEIPLHDKPQVLVVAPLRKTGDELIERIRAANATAVWVPDFGVALDLAQLVERVDMVVVDDAGAPDWTGSELLAAMRGLALAHRPVGVWLTDDDVAAAEQPGVDAQVPRATFDCDTLAAVLLLAQGGACTA